jgi:hypothetical protein
VKLCQSEELAGPLEQYTGRTVGEIEKAGIRPISAGESFQCDRLRVAIAESDSEHGLAAQ